MALSFVGQATGSTSASLSGTGWAAGDLAIVCHYRQAGSGGDPTMPAGWTDLGFPSGYTASHRVRVGYRVLQSGDTATGTSTNATDTALIILRGQDTTTPIGATATQTFSSGVGTITYPEVTLQVTDGTSWVIGIGGSRVTTATMETAPSGMTNRSHRVGTGEVGIHTTGGVSSWSATDAVVGGTGTNSHKATWSIEVRAASTGVTVVPGTASLVLTTYAPNVLTPRLVVPGTAALSLTTFAPTVTVGVRVVPGTANLVLTTFAPNVLTPRVVVPGTASLVLTTFAPNVLTPRVVVPGTASLVLTTFAPDILVGGPVLVVPGTAALALTTFAPTVSVRGIETGSDLQIVLDMLAFWPVYDGLATDAERAAYLRDFVLAHGGQVRMNRRTNQWELVGGIYPARITL